MEAAIAACRAGTSINAAARQHNIPPATLFRRIKAPVDQCVNKKLGRYRSVFSEEQEKILVDYVLQMEERLFGLTLADLKSVAYQLAVRNNISHPFNTEKQVAGKDWVNGFLKRNPTLSLRLPEKTSAARASAFNEVNVKKFFDLLDKLYENHRYPRIAYIIVMRRELQQFQISLPKLYQKRGKNRWEFCPQPREERWLLLKFASMRPENIFLQLWYFQGFDTM